MAVSVVALLAGCGGPEVRESYYTLAAAASAPPAASAAAKSIFVGPVSVPESVDRSPLVLQTGANQVEITDAHRWAEPLKDAIPRVIADNLARELGTPRVYSSRGVSTQPVDYRVAVEVRRFDSSLDQGATLDALWTVTPASGPSRSGRTFAHEAAATRDPSGVVAAHGRALARLSADIAAALR